MNKPRPVEHADASPEVRAIFDDIKATRKVAHVNNFWKYRAVSVTNGCSYGIACHTALARKAGMTDAIFGELMAVVGMANQTNRFADGYRLPIDDEFNA